ncbi:MAG: type II secretion system secretin GspD [Acetobacteraceae bacterium]
MTLLLSLFGAEPMRFLRHCGVVGVVLLIALPGCQPPPPPPEAGVINPDLPPQPVGRPIPMTGEAIQLGTPAPTRRLTGATEIVMGTGQFANPSPVAAGGQRVALVGSDVSLNFANVDVRDVLKSVLGDLLRLSYTVDPAVTGHITLQTGAPIPRSSVIGVLTNALQLSGIGLVQHDGLYAAVPIANASRAATVGGSVGFITRVVTPQYAAAAELERALQPLVPPGASLKADPGRNLLMVSGSAQDVGNIIANVDSFDVDYLRGMSFGLFPLRNGRARDVASDLTKLMTTSLKPIADMVKIAPIDRINAILVTSMQPAYLRRVQEWIERIDRGDGRTDQQLFIYRVQNGRAADLAKVLRRALGLEPQGGGGGGGQGSSFDTESNPTTGNAPGSGGGVDPLQTALGGGTDTSPSGGAPGSAPPPPVSPGAGRNELLGSVPAAAALNGPVPQSGVRVTADTTNNALIISATPQEYAPIEAALEKLDITPLQVLIEATVAEVTLNDKLDMGLQYFIKSGNFAGIFAPGVTAAINSGTTAAGFPGVGVGTNITVAYSSGGTNIILQALASVSTVRVLSSPDLLVLNNGTARLQVGDQLPIATQSATSNLAPGAPTVNSISYRDTGVILQITPRVNASGLVLLDMSEQVSQPTQATQQTNVQQQSPTISNRSVTSSLAIHDGQTIVLAGLIQENRLSGTSGLPYLKDLPVVGFLFGVKSEQVKRTELIVLVTPHVIRNREDVNAVTTELRHKLRMTVPVAARAR